MVANSPSNLANSNFSASARLFIVIVITYKNSTINIIWLILFLSLTKKLVIRTFVNYGKKVSIIVLSGANTDFSLVALARGKYISPAVLTALG